MIRQFIFILTVFFMLPSAVMAAGAGDKIPHDLALKDQRGQVQSLETLSGDQGIALIFVRSVDWCPYCQVQLLDLREEGKAIEDLGYNIVPISYDAPDVLKRFADKYGFAYTMLSDEGSEAIKAFDILNDKFDPDHFAYGVPHPYIYIIGKDQHIRAVLGEGSVKDRPQSEAIVEAIQSLN